MGTRIMTAKTTAKSKKKMPATEEATSTTAKDSTDTGLPPEVTSLEKVRDILFGEEVQRLSERQEQINAHLTQQIGDLKTATSEKIKTLEHALIQKIDALGAQLNTEEKQRSRDVTGLQQQLDDNISGLETQIKNSLADLYDQLMGECNRLQAESDKLAEQLSESSQDLSDAKADRTTLAKLLKDMASNLEAGQ